MSTTTSTINPSAFSNNIPQNPPSSLSPLSIPSPSPSAPKDFPSLGNEGSPPVPLTDQSLSDVLKDTSASNALFTTPDLNLSDDDVLDLGDEPLTQETTLESILPLSGKAKEVEMSDQMLSGECTDLLNTLGVNASSIEKLCSQNLYDKVIDVKNNFTSTLNKYREKISEINADFNTLQNALLNENLELDTIRNIEESINIVSEKRDTIMDEFKSLMLLHKSISNMTDSIFEIRTDLLAALKILSDKINQKLPLTPSGVDEDTVAVLQKVRPTVVDSLLQKSEPAVKSIEVAEVIIPDENDSELLFPSPDENDENKDIGNDENKDIGNDVAVTVDDILKSLQNKGVDIDLSDNDSSTEDDEVF